jgi:hypothetical protein
MKRALEFLTPIDEAMRRLGGFAPKLMRPLAPMLKRGPLPLRAAQHELIHTVGDSDLAPGRAPSRSLVGYWGYRSLGLAFDRVATARIEAVGLSSTPPRRGRGQRRRRLQPISASNPCCLPSPSFRSSFRVQRLCVQSQAIPCGRCLQKDESSEESWWFSLQAPSWAGSGGLRQRRR